MAITSEVSAPPPPGAYRWTMTSTFGSVLKEWRSTRRMSQLDLGSIAEVSPRHISFLESGRSNPSRPMVLHLADVLEVPRPERNRLLGAAGFSPIYIAHEPTSEAMEPIRKAIAWTVERHDPYPAFVLDRHWNVIDANSSAEFVLAMLGVPANASMLELFVDPAGIRGQIENWPEVGYFLLTRLRTESSVVGGDPVLDAAIAQLVADPTIAPPDEGPLPPALAAVIRLGDSTVSLLSTIAHFGSAEDIALADHRIELFFPADEQTEAIFNS